VTKKALLFDSHALLKLFQKEHGYECFCLCASGAFLFNDCLGHGGCELRVLAKRETRNTKLSFHGGMKNTGKINGVK